MKFCSKCGTQLVDDAIVCTNCGCLVSGAPAQAPTPMPTPTPTAEEVQPLPTRKGTSVAVPILNFVFSILLATALFFILLSIADMVVRADGYGSIQSYSSYSSKTGYYIDVDVDVYAYPSTDYMTVGLIAALAALPVSIISLVFTAKEKLGNEHLFSAIFKVVAAALAVTLTLCGNAF